MAAISKTLFEFTYNDGENIGDTISHWTDGSIKQSHQKW